MDLSKYPLEKLVYFVAGVIPGFTALLIYAVSVPWSFGWFFATVFLGYKAKLSLVMVASFLVGNSLTSFLSRLLGATGGAISSTGSRNREKAWQVSGGARSRKCLRLSGCQETPLIWSHFSSA